MEPGDYFVVAVALLAAVVVYLDRPKRNPPKSPMTIDRAYLRRTDPVWQHRGTLR